MIQFFLVQWKVQAKLKKCLCKVLKTSGVYCLKSSIKPPRGGLFTSNTFEVGEGRIFRKDDGISSSHSLILRRPRSFAVPFEKTSEVVRESKGTANELGRLRIRLFWEREGSERDRENDLGRLRIRLFFTKNYNYKLRKLKFKTLKVICSRGSKTNPDL